LENRPGSRLLFDLSGGHALCHGAGTLYYFWKDWKRIILGLLRSIKHITIANLSAEHKADARLGWLLVVGTVPAGLLGLLFQNKLQALFASPKYVSIFLICNGLGSFWSGISEKKKGKNDQGSSKKSPVAHFVSRHPL